jgi:hypothetical protein
VVSPGFLLCATFVQEASAGTFGGFDAPWQSDLSSARTTDKPQPTPETGSAVSSEGRSSPIVPACSDFRCTELNTSYSAAARGYDSTARNRGRERPWPPPFPTPRPSSRSELCRATLFTDSISRLPG